MFQHEAVGCIIDVAHESKTEIPDEGNHMTNRASTNNPRRPWIPSVILTFVFSLFVLAQEVQLPPELPVPESDKTVPYVPTPPEVVNKMLDLAKVGPNDMVYDLGSGDGRIVIMAVEKYGAQALGVELDEERVKQSSARLVELGLEKRAKIVRGNLFETDLRPATVLTLYLLPSVNQRLRPRLEKELRPGARVVSHDFTIEGWKAEQTATVTSENGSSHTVYLYVLPQPQAAAGN
jgi:precorrin-6B methylase 2